MSEVKVKVCGVLGNATKIPFPKTDIAVATRWVTAIMIDNVLYFPEKIYRAKNTAYVKKRVLEAKLNPKK